MRKTLIAIIVLFFLVGSYFYINGQSLFFRPTESTIEEGISEVEAEIEIIANNLQIPWSIVFLPNGDMLVTERPGNLLLIGEDHLNIEIPDVQQQGEGGLLGVAIHPDFENNNWIYLYLTTKVEDGLINRIERYKLQGNELTDRQLIIENIPGATFHDGGQMAFGPDGLLYVTTGDAGNSSSAQDLSSLAGKVLRFDEDYEVEIYSYGHRNSQALTWDDQGRLWSTEHGRSGVTSGLDELNLIEQGQNYGWPIIQGDESQPGMISPKIQSGPDETWAPADAVFLNSSIFFTGLRGESLYQAKIDQDGNVTEFKAHFREEYGRLRALEIGPDGYLYMSTSNQDGRGRLRTNDDKILRINPKIFN